MSNPESSKIIGWRETVSLPDWDVGAIKAKVDTGARTSSIHARHIELLENGDVRFEVVVSEKPTRKSVWVTATPSRESVVTPQPGTRQRRFVFRTTLQVGDSTYEIELNLVNRQGMLCRMLIGRTALAGRYLVQPAATNLLTSRRTGAPKSGAPKPSVVKPGKTT